MKSASSQHDSSSSNEDDNEDSVDDTFDFMKSKLSKKVPPKSVAQSVDNSMEVYKKGGAGGKQMENITLLGKPRAMPIPTVAAGKQPPNKDTNSRMTRGAYRK